MILMLLVLLVFAVIAVMVFAVGLVIRDLRSGAVPPDSEPAPLQRLAPLTEPTEDQGPITSFDQWFARLHSEGDWQWNPMMTVSVLLSIGLIVCISIKRTEILFAFNCSSASNAT